MNTATCTNHVSKHTRFFDIFWRVLLARGNHLKPSHLLLSNVTSRCSERIELICWMIMAKKTLHIINSSGKRRSSSTDSTKINISSQNQLESIFNFMCPKKLNRVRKFQPRKRTQIRSSPIYKNPKRNRFKKNQVGNPTPSTGTTWYLHWSYRTHHQRLCYQRK